jgi:capsular polysaccharide export protein
VLVLRSPPFAGIDAAVAAVSFPRVRADPRPGGGLERDAATLQALGGFMVRERVGGSFWGRQIVLPGRCARWIHADSAQDALLRVDRALHGLDAARIFVSFPDATGAPAAMRLLRAKGVTCAAGDIDPWSILQCCDGLETKDDDELAFFAGLAGVPVLGRGGAADDGADAAAIAAVLVDPVTYRDPFTGMACQAQDAANILADWRRQIDANRFIAAGAGVARWKREQVARMCWSGTAALPPMSRSWRAPLMRARRDGGALIAWPSRVPGALIREAGKRNVPLARVEDGFIRSVGLGSDCYPPFSIVVDSRGIYYDAQTPSDLEWLLEHGSVSPALRDRATVLAGRMVDGGVTKYGVGRSAPTYGDDGRRKVLVVGQVEDDLSVLTSGGAVGGNFELLRRVRADRPDALIVFRPHPDVLAGHRQGHVDEASALTLADRVDRHSSMSGLIEAVDEVHVLTSLAGFEALLRGKPVVTHGSPFYAGWGLTQDRGPAMPRRTRRLELSELVAGTLILYPRYLDPVTRLPCSPEVLLDRLVAGYVPPETVATRFRRMLGRVKVVLGPAK